jgi:uncharacterized membrane protein
VTRALIVLLLCAGVAGVAHAGETGGSMGGGDWDDAPSAPTSYEPSSSSSASYSSSSSSDDYTTPSYSHDYDHDRASSGSSGSGGHGSSGPPPLWMLGIFGVFAIGMVIQFVRDARPAPLGHVDAAKLIAQGADTDVSVLAIAFDARARVFAQKELARIAQQADTKTAEGRATMLREVALLLRRLRDAWVYGGAINEPMMWKRDAQQVFTRHVADARARFETETVRNEQGVTTRAVAPALHPTTDDGPGLMLVTIVVAARHELFTVEHVADGEDLRKALEALSSMTAAELIAIEIVWMPSAEDERLSSIALEAAYADRPLIAIAGARVGKVFCAYCGAPYPAESIACPNCGGRPAGA